MRFPVPGSLIAVVGAFLIGAFAACQSEEERNFERGTEIVRSVSDQLAGAQTFSFKSEEVHHRMASDGTLKERRFSRETIIRRPDGVWFQIIGPDRDGEGFYNGESLTLVGNREQAWAQVPLPPTIDEAIDVLAVDYNVPMPMADFLYSSPYEALISEDTRGGWVGEETVAGKQCDHLAFESDVVDWELWVSKEEQPMPCQLLITYKQDPGPPTSQLTFLEWNLAAQADDSRFEPMIPEGYRRIPVIAAPAEPEVSDVQPPDSIEAASPDPTDEAADTTATGN